MQEQHAMIEEDQEKERSRQNHEVFGHRSASSHLLAQLQKRSSYNMRFDRYMDSGYHGMRDYAYKKWQVSSCVELDIGFTNAEVTCMEFDSRGVLLALSDNKGYIRIFDFDEVNAAELAAKQKKVSTNVEETKKVEPYRSFPTTNYRISCLKWNPFHENLLGVTFL
jgi:WD40 repeat protein